MSDRLNELANSASALRSTLTVCGQSKPQLDEDLRDISALLRAASAETAGTEWGSAQFLDPSSPAFHNNEIHAARVAIADLKAERDEATKMAYMILPGDERNPGVTWREAYEILDEKALGEKHGHACAVSTIAEQRDSALASLADKQRAIDEALAAWDDWYQRDGVIDNVEAALRPHATKATEEKPSATVTGSQTPAINVVFDGPPGPESGCFVEVETDDGASINAGEWIKRPDGLWWLRIALPAPADDTRELVARLAACIVKDRDQDYHGNEFVNDLDAIIAIARRGGGA